MPKPLEYKRRVRLAEVADELPPTRRRWPTLGAGVLAWTAVVAVCWGVSAGTIPIDGWMTEPSAVSLTPGKGASRAANTRPAPRAARRVASLPMATTAPVAAAPPTPPAPAAPPAHPDPTLPLPAEPVRAPVAAAQPAEPPPLELAPLDDPKPSPIDEELSAPRAAPAPAPVGPIPRGATCEAAIATYRESITMGATDAPPDLSAADYGAVLNRGSYLSGCGVPASSTVDVCVAVRNGRAEGVTVALQPKNPGVEACVARAVWQLSFPHHPRMDVARTRFGR